VISLNYLPVFVIDKTVCVATMYRLRYTVGQVIGIFVLCNRCIHNIKMRYGGEPFTFIVVKA
jgi:hypothetical protein